MMAKAKRRTKRTARVEKIPPRVQYWPAAGPSSRFTLEGLLERIELHTWGDESPAAKLTARTCRELTVRIAELLMALPSSAAEAVKASLWLSLRLGALGAELGVKELVELGRTNVTARKRGAAKNHDKAAEDRRRWLDKAVQMRSRNNQLTLRSTARNIARAEKRRMKTVYDFLRANFSK